MVMELFDNKFLRWYFGSLGWVLMKIYSLFPARFKTETGLQIVACLNLLIGILLPIVAVCLVARWMSG